MSPVASLSRHCEERSDEATPQASLRGPKGLAMTAILEVSDNQKPPRGLAHDHWHGTPRQRGQRIDRNHRHH